jgi:hypothetical protein
MVRVNKSGISLNASSLHIGHRHLLTRESFYIAMYDDISKHWGCLHINPRHGLDISFIVNGHFNGSFEFSVAISSDEL